MKMIAVFNLKNKVGKFWLSKEPIKFLNSWQVRFKDGEIASYTKYLHREDGPAIEYSDGTKYWYINRKFHREDGPAIEYPSGANNWWWHGERLDVYSQEEFEIWKRFKNFQ